MELRRAFIGLIDACHITEDAKVGASNSRVDRHQLAVCTYDVRPGPGNQLHWSIPAGHGYEHWIFSAARTA